MMTSVLATYDVHLDKHIDKISPSPKIQDSSDEFEKHSSGGVL